MMKIKKVCLVLCLSWLSIACENRKSNKETAILKSPSIESNFTEWHEGFLDIHRNSTGSGDATFFIFPDGTTMLFDAGNLDKQKFEKEFAPLKATAPIPDDSLIAAQWIAHYLGR